MESTAKIKDFKNTDWRNFRILIEEQLTRNPVPHDRCLNNDEIDEYIAKTCSIINTVQSSEIPTFAKYKDHYKNTPREIITLIKDQRKIKKALNREKAKIFPNITKIQDLKLATARNRLEITKQTRQFMRTSFETKIMNLIPGPHFFTQ